MTKNMEKTTPMKGNGKSPEDLDKALLFVDDLLDRMLCPYVLAGETLKSVIGGQVDGDKIEVIVLRKHFGEEARSVFGSCMSMIYKKKEIKEKGGCLNLEHEGVPIEIKIVDRKYGFLKQPDMIYYKYDMFKIPNPWLAYWKVRGIVK